MQEQETDQPEPTEEPIRLGTFIHDIAMSVGGVELIIERDRSEHPPIDFT
ncbi:MAG: hypothetical protein LBM23_03695 [Propionibacteriaceae bacterium]|jgi:hypothetical protein|nr:hypothetical protein [Propionibacteriaceae bacterium]